MSNLFIGGPLDGERHVIARDRMNMPARVSFYQPQALIHTDKLPWKDAQPCRLPVEVGYRRELLERDEDGAKLVVYVEENTPVTEAHRESAFADIEIDHLEAMRREANPNRRKR